MNRRGFLGALAGMAASLTLDPEKLLCVPGKKLISIPAAIEDIDYFEVWRGADPCFDLISTVTLEQLRANVVFDNLFVDAPLSKRLRSRAMESFSGGASL
jgi:hypothetical protein